MIHSIEEASLEALKTLVFGATGNVGRAVVDELLSVGEGVRAVTRAPDKATPRAGLHWLRVDWEEKESLDAALKGVERVFFMAKARELPAQTRLLVEAAEAAGAQHLVFLSSMAAFNSAADSTGRRHAEAEDILRASRLMTTVLRPGTFTTNLLFGTQDLQQEGVVRIMVDPDVPMAVIDPKDIGVIAAKMLRSGAHIGEPLVLTGPEALSYREQIRILSERLGRQLRPESLSDEAILTMLGSLTENERRAMLNEIRQIGKGPEAIASKNLKALLGRSPRTFQDWLDENLNAFR